METFKKFVNFLWYLLVLTGTIILLTFSVFSLQQCTTTKQMIYEGNQGFVIIRKEYSNVETLGKYYYVTYDESGIVLIYTNKNFDIGDTIKLEKKNNAGKFRTIL